MEDDSVTSLQRLQADIRLRKSRKGSRLKNPRGCNSPRPAYAGGDRTVPAGTAR